MTTTAINLKVASWLPTGESNGWSIRRTVERNGTEVYTSLFGPDNHEWMTDYRVAQQEHQVFVDVACNDVVLTGLGIGYLPAWLFREGRCKRIRIVEKNLDVVQLVWPHLQNIAPNADRIIKLIQADADEWIPKWCDFVWFDHGMHPLESEQRKMLKHNYAGRAGSIHFWERM